MIYPYSQTNRLEKPHSYMYTPFQGEALLRAYQSSRMATVRHCAAAKQKSHSQDDRLIACSIPALAKALNTVSPEGGKLFQLLLENGGVEIPEECDVKTHTLLDYSMDLENLTASDPITTLDLLHGLIVAQLTDLQSTHVKIWLNRLVQRFEVTKKLYEFYPPGFRKGEGQNTSVRLYWLFALALCLFQARSSSIKYLNTLLKVCDLLCSLPEEALQDSIPVQGLQLVLATEMTGIQLLSEKKELPFAPE